MAIDLPLLPRLTLPLIRRLDWVVTKGKESVKPVGSNSASYKGRQCEWKKGKHGMLQDFACRTCAGTMLIFSVSPHSLLRLVLKDS